MSRRVDRAGLGWDRDAQRTAETFRARVRRDFFASEGEVRSLRASYAVRAKEGDHAGALGVAILDAVLAWAGIRVGDPKERS